MNLAVCAMRGSERLQSPILFHVTAAAQWRAVSNLRFDGFYRSVPYSHGANALGRPIDMVWVVPIDGLGATVSADGG